MYDDHYDEACDPNAPRCSITTFLHRVAFTVLHASLFLENVCGNALYRGFFVVLFLHSLSIFFRIEHEIIAIATYFFVTLRYLVIRTH